MRNINCNVLQGPDTATKTGIQIDSNQLLNPSFHVYFGDTSVAGTVKLQASNDICNDRYQAAAFTVTNWVDIPNQSATITSGASALLTLSEVNYRWLRVVFTSS